MRTLVGLSNRELAGSCNHYHSRLCPIGLMGCRQVLSLKNADRNRDGVLMKEERPTPPMLDTKLQRKCEEEYRRGDCLTTEEWIKELRDQLDKS